MRVLVATDSWTGLRSRQVGTALARAWAGLGDEVAVIPMGTAGAGFRQAFEDLREAAGLDILAPSLPDAGADRWTTGSEPLGRLIAGLPADGGRVVIELSRAPWRDGGRGMVEYLRSRTGREGRQGRARLPIVVTTAEQAGLELTGLRGVVSLEGRAERMDPARMLALDQALCDWAEELTGDPEAGTVPGSGALGGIGLAVSALGGQVTTGPRLLLDLADARRTVSQADLVVTGCEHLDFQTLGGEVVTQVLKLAEPLGVPVIAVPLTSEVSARELRQARLEAAAPLDGGPVGGAADMVAVTAAAGPVARTWHWGAGGTSFPTPLTLGADETESRPAPTDPSRRRAPSPEAIRGPFDHQWSRPI